MKKAIRIGLTTASLGLGAALFAAPSAQAQVSFFGRFPVPHGSIGIAFGSPYYPIGSYVPYSQRIVYAPDYGYGFYCDSGEWVSVRQSGRRWVVIERPTRGFGAYGYRGNDRFDRGDRFDRRDRFDRQDRFDRRDRSDRRDGRDGRGRDWR